MNFESQPYKPTLKEIEAAENMITDKQKQQSFEREQHINKTNIERSKNDKKYQVAADLENKKRKLGDIVLGKNKISYIDIAREEASRENQIYDKNVQEEKVLQESLRKSFDDEKKFAELGIWNKTDSRFISFVGSKAESQRLEYEKYLNELSSINSQALQNLFDEEVIAIHNGTWVPEDSRLFVENYSSAEVDELKREKNKKFTELVKVQKEFTHTKKEKLYSEILDLFDDHYSKEVDAAQNGLWRKKDSFFLRYLKDEDTRIQTLAQNNLNNLFKINQEKISDDSKENIKIIYKKELMEAESGEWDKESSYFTTIQQDPLFELFDEEVKEIIINHLFTLSFVNFENKFNDEENKSESSGMSKEDAAKVLNINLHTSTDEAKKSYRQLMMKNHPDRGGNIEKAKEVTEAWRIFNS